MLRDAGFRRRGFYLAVLVLVGLAGGGCDKKLRGVVLPDARPTVRLTFAPAASRRLR